MKLVCDIVLIVLLCGSVHGQNLTVSGSKKGAPSGRIINGVCVTIESYPFMASLRIVYSRGGSSRCGATIISNKNAVTAAHCLYQLAPSTITLRVGSTMQDYEGVLFTVSSYVLHPNYNPNTFDSDAAILTISGSFANILNVTPIRLQETEIAISDTNPPTCYALGWGLTNAEKGTRPQNLQFAKLLLLAQSTCEDYFYPFDISAQMICAQYNNIAMCYGDSGGPLVCNNRLIGITSFGEPGCQTSGINVFGKIPSSSILSFIKSNMVN